MATPVLRTASPAQLDIEIKQGETFDPTLKRWTDATKTTGFDFTGYSARMHVREAVDSLTTLLELGTATGEIAMDNAGVIAFALTDVETAALDWTVGVYDFELIDPAGRVQRYLKGKVKVVREITR